MSREVRNSTYGPLDCKELKIGADSTVVTCEYQRADNANKRGDLIVDLICSHLIFNCAARPGKRF